MGRRSRAAGVADRTAQQAGPNHLAFAAMSGLLKAALELD